MTGGPHQRAGRRDGPGAASGLAILADVEGRIRDVLCDDEGLLGDRVDDRPLTDFVAEASREAAMGFVATVRERGAAFDRELQVRGPTASGRLHWSGLRIGRWLVLVATDARVSVPEIGEDVIRITNEQANAIRSLAKDLVSAGEDAAHRDHLLYGELSRINNELIDLQRQLAKTNTELERLHEEKNRFLGMAAHELRTPLGIVSSYVDFLVEDAATLDEEQQGFVRTIQRAVAGMRDLVDDLLDVARIEEGRLDLRREPVDLSSLVRERIALHQRLAEHKSILIDASVPDAPLVAMVDGPKVGQVLDNLVTNAVKFSPRGSTVWVRLGTVDEEVELRVVDEGIGISAEDVDALFSPFTGAARQGTAGERGTGLGLAIVKRLVEGHGGTVTVKSEPGFGSTFAVVVPREPLACG